jgi:dienelactone hydrolase
MNHLEHEDGSPRRIVSVTQWRSIREAVVAAFESVAGPLPLSWPASRTVPLDMSIDEEVDCGKFVRRLIYYTAVEGSRTPAYLCVPKVCLVDADQPEPQRRPAVLCLHGTDDEVGHGTVVGLSSKENRSYASELAERGYVTLAPSYPLLANYQDEPASRGFESGTMMAIVDNMRGLDLLDSLPFVANQTPPRFTNGNGTALTTDYYEYGNTDDPNSYQPGRYGAIGHSLGGHNSVYTALFDPRLAVVVSSCGLDSFRVQKTHILCAILYQKLSFYQGRLGTYIEGELKKRCVFRRITWMVMLLAGPQLATCRSFLSFR